MFTEAKEDFPVRDYMLELLQTVVAELANHHRIFDMILIIAEAAREEHGDLNLTINIKEFCFQIKNSYRQLNDMHSKGETFREIRGQKEIVTNTFFLKILANILRLNGSNYHANPKSLIERIRKRFQNRTPLFPGDSQLVKRNKKMFAFFAYKWLTSPCLEIVHQILLADLETSKMMTKKARDEGRTLLLRSFRKNNSL